MATYEQLMEGARRADAAGDGAGARRFLELALEAKQPAITGADAMRARGLSSPDPTNANQTATDEMVLADNPATARVLSFNKGVPFIGSWQDEAYGMLGGDEARDKTRAITGAIERQRPGQDMALGLAGGVVGSLPALAAAPAVGAAAPASLLGRVGMGAAIGGTGGAVEGAVYGAGRGEEGGRGEAMLDGATLGGAMGLGLGAGVPVVSDAVSAIAGNLLKRPSKAAARSVGLDPKTAETVINALQADEALSGAGRSRIAAAGPGAMLADAGPSAGQLLDNAVGNSGPGGRIALAATEQRAADAGGAVSKALRDMAPDQQIAIKGTPLGQLYDTAYSRPIDYSSAVGRSIEADAKRIPKGIVDRANKLIAMDADASGVRQIIAEVGEDGRVVYGELPNVQQLDYMTRALNDVARAGDGQGALGGNTNEGRIFGKLSRSIRTALKDAVPEYKTALDQAATEIGAKQAREMAPDILSARMTRQDVAETIESMGAAEVGHLRIGIRDAVEEALANVKRTVTDGNVDARQATKAIKDFSSDAARDKLRIVFGANKADDFIKQMDEAAAAIELRADVGGNSKTFVRQTLDREIDDRLMGGPIETAARGEPIGGVKRVVQAMTGRTPEANIARKQGVYEEIARLMTESRGPDALNTMRVLEQISQTNPNAEALAALLGRNVALGAAAPAYLQGR